jgi:hypothetical protein
MIDLAVAAFVLEKSSFKPVLPGQNSRSEQSNRQLLIIVGSLRWKPITERSLLVDESK